MACRISELVIDAADPGRLAAFWSQVLDYVELGREDDGSIEIGPPEAGFGGLQPTRLRLVTAAGRSYGARSALIVMRSCGILGCCQVSRAELVDLSVPICRRVSANICVYHMLRSHFLTVASWPA